jgi:hypothetical protein
MLQLAEEMDKAVMPVNFAKRLTHPPGVAYATRREKSRSGQSTELRG